MLSAPKRVRHFLQNDPAVQTLVLHLFLAAVEQGLRRCSPGANPALRIGAVAFIHRLGALLNPHVHFHCVVIEGVFEADGAGSVRFHEARGIGPETIAEIQAQVRHHPLSVLARRGVLEREDAEAMGTWNHGGGFSVDASVLHRRRTIAWGWCSCCANAPDRPSHWSSCAQSMLSAWSTRLSSRDRAAASA
ncbi:MAG: transposase [Sterolibacteriaceae bacterium]|uniref:Transposase n=1 Tax=Candidatus Methylophosphatis roskildensis TaxID=2899263 RepID=A0A9D7DY47_9PROT|nr:transposase [Candidatus Methylophosphatis roskildensis]MBK7237637.1 transposase [Sterolibacteriaceae bacterium]